jgi:F-box/TPR repeat protein Pof3
MDPVFTTLQSLESLTLTRFALNTFPALPPSIRLFHYTAATSWNQFTLNPAALLNGENTLNALSSDLPHLISLALANIGSLDAEFLDLLLLRTGDGPNDNVDLATATSLTHLSFANTSIPTRAALLACLSNPRLTTLTSLDLTDSLADDDIVSHICKTFPALERVNLAKTRISGVAVKQLCLELGALKWIGADFCAGITSQDAVIWARGKGVEVSWRFEKGGKKGKAGWRERYL